MQYTVLISEVTSPTLINQASDSAMGPHERVALSSSKSDIILPESFSLDGELSCEEIYALNMLN